MTSQPERAIARLRKVGTYEGISFLVLLLVAMPLKYVWGEPLAVKVVGWIHGILFVWFCFALLEAKNAAGWSVRRALPYFVAALLPAGPFVADRSLRGEEERLRGLAS